MALWCRVDSLEYLGLYIMIRSMLFKVEEEVHLRMMAMLKGHP
jgi:hypothetical protein